MVNSRILLSPPHMGQLEHAMLAEAFSSNFIAPFGPHVDAFEREFGHTVGAPYAVAVSSGTAALHLALQLVGVRPGDEVFVSSLTFIASVNPIRYCGASPVFIDSERRSWNMDPDLLASALYERATTGKLPRAVVVVHLYGQSADLDPIVSLCEEFGVQLVEDAAEALGATYYGSAPGTLGRAGVYSFNGNKIVTTSGGGMLVSEDPTLTTHARKLATQAREPATHYEHQEIGYNYRLSNLLAAVGRAQLRVLGERVAARRRNFAFYLEALSDLPGLAFMPEAPWGRSTHWLTAITLDPDECDVDPEMLRQALAAEEIEARPVWKPMHLQPVFRGYPVVGGDVADDLFSRGLCLPSGSSLTEADLDRVVSVIRRVYARARSTKRLIAAAPSQRPTVRSHPATGATLGT